MRSLRICSFLIAAALVTSLSLGQEKKGDAKDTKKDEPAPKAKGFLPTYWGQLGLSDDQKQKVYKIQSKYGDEIEKLEAKIKELKEKRDKERFEVLSAEQKKRLEDIIKSKTGAGKSDK